MKIRMKVEGSGPDGMVQPGEEVEVGADNAWELVEAGKAELVEEEEPAEETAAVDAGDEAALAEDGADDAEAVEETAADEEDMGEARDEGGLETE